MIKHIQDAISYGLYEDFRAEDSTLVAGFHECFGEQLDCEAFSSWPDEKEAGVLHLALGEDKQFKISIEEEQTRQLDITPVESEIARMSRISKAGEAKDYYNVHDTIVVDGITFEIVGIGHDIDVYTERRNTITLRQVDHLKKRCINSGSYPIDGYTASELDQSLIESPQSWIPDSILPYVREVSKAYVTCDGSIKVMYRKLWVFSESEMFGSAIYSPDEDGKRYEAFATRKDRVAYDKNGSACRVWLRSASVDSSISFCMVNASGSASIDIAYASRGVALGFCI